MTATVLYLLILLVPNGPGFESPSASYQLCVLHQVNLIRWLLLYEKVPHSLVAGILRERENENENERAIDLDSAEKSCKVNL